MGLNKDAFEDQNAQVFVSLDFKADFKGIVQRKVRRVENRLGQQMFIQRWRAGRCFRY
jgi:hypothetical protein